MTVDRILDAMRAALAAGGTSEDVLAAARRAAARGARDESPPPPPVSTAYRAVDGDVLDAVALAAYGTEYALVALLAANPELAGSAPHLGAGDLVGLPVLDPPAIESRTVQIWD